MMNQIENIKKNLFPKIIFNENEKSQYISDVICASSNKEVRIAFLEEKIINDSEGNVTMAKVCDTQIVMTPTVAHNMIKLLEKHLSDIDE